jgi:hypothetical protein
MYTLCYSTWSQPTSLGENLPEFDFDKTKKELESKEMSRNILFGSTIGPKYIQSKGLEPKYLKKVYFISEKMGKRKKYILNARRKGK